MSSFIEKFGSRLPRPEVVAARLAKYPSLQPQTVSMIARRGRVETSASLARADALAIGAQAKRALSGEAAGLVPYKTTLDSTISFAKSIVAERRVNRLKKSVWASGHLHGFADAGFRAPQCWFVTLTYARVNAWAGNHISKAVQAFRNWCQSKGVACRYTWVSEIQPKRLERTGEAVVHYHLLAWLARSLKDLLSIVDQLEIIGCGFKSLTEPIDTTNPVGRLMLNILGSMAEFERSLIRERSMAGQAAARLRGKHCGRPRVVQPSTEADIVEKYATGNYTLHGLAALMKVNPSVVKRAVYRVTKPESSSLK